MKYTLAVVNEETNKVVLVVSSETPIEVRLFTVPNHRLVLKEVDEPK